MAAFSYYFKVEWDDAGVADTDVISAIEGAFSAPEDVTITDSTDTVEEALAPNSFGADIRAALDSVRTLMDSQDYNKALDTFEGIPAMVDTLRRGINFKRAGGQ